MVPWAQASLLAALCIGAHYLLVRAASGRLGDTLAALILEGTAALGILLAFLLGPRDESPTTRAGVVFAALSGLCISAGSILMFLALRRGGPVASTGTIMLGGGVTLSALLAPWIFGEGFTLRRGLGIGLGLAAMALLSTDR
jgi:uncharacterized membrane protein